MTFAGLDIAKLFINGELVDAEGKATYDNINPATEEVLGQAADASAGDVDAAIGAAHEAFYNTSWATDVALRVRCLRQLHQALGKYTDAIPALNVAEVGLPSMISATAGLATPLQLVEYAADLLESYPFYEDHGDADLHGIRSHRWTEREAMGVVAAITPWNQPSQVNLAKISPALAAGNAVILKAAPTTPWLAASLGKIVAEHTEIPPGIFNVITSSVNDRGEELLTDPRVDMISFTGSTAVGRHIMERGSATIKRCFLELGGKSASIVLEDADFATALGYAAFQVCIHGGQGCATLSRLLLPRSRFDEGVEMVAQMMRAVPYGDPLDPQNVMGPLNSARHRDRVEGIVDRALAAGATAVVGGGRATQFDRGYYFQPTLLTGLAEDAEIVRNEVFGPVLVALPFEDEEDAIRIANDSIFGLSGAVYSGDREHSKAVARRVRAGTMIVDGGIYYGPDMPFGGYKQSGVGREMGEAGFEEYLEIKSFCEPLA